MRHLLSFGIVIGFMLACTEQPDTGPEKTDWSPVKVEVVETGTGYQLLRGGKPYVIRGAGMEHNDIAAFSSHGGNAIRNCSTRSKLADIGDLLDTAQAHGVTVMLCLPMQAERHGFDYDDEAAVAAQLHAFREDVLRYRDHPALLAWIIGNEVNHSYRNPKVFDAVNAVSDPEKKADSPIKNRTSTRSRIIARPHSRIYTTAPRT